MSHLDPSAILGPGGAIARRLDGYEARPEQMRMAEAVSKAIEDEHHLMVEAGTGVGKSFAYLVPAILAAAVLGKKVVVSTHTISLQEQLLGKDVPFLRAVSPHEFSAVLVKGRSNYVSLRRLAASSQRAGATFQEPGQHQELMAIDRWATTTEDGSRSDLDFRPEPAVWESVASEHGNCLGRKCPRFRDCHYYKARARAKTANILVVNHALYMSDLALRASGASILPEHEVVIFDEAHTLEGVAGDHLGLRLTSVGVDYGLARLYNERTHKGLLAFHELEDSIRQAIRTRQAAREFFEAVASWQAAKGATNGRLRRPLPIRDTLGEELRKLSSTIGREAEELEEEHEQKIEIHAARGRLDAAAETLGGWLSGADPEESVDWIELEPGRRKVTLARAPLDVGPALRRDLFGRVPTVVLTSATLAVGSPPSFAFAKARLGLSKCTTLQLGSPFDYRSQVTLHIPRAVPRPRRRPARVRGACDRADPRLSRALAWQGVCLVHFLSGARRRRAGPRALARGE